MNQGVEMTKSDIYSPLVSCDGDWKLVETKYCTEVLVDSVREIFEGITDWLVVMTVMEVKELDEDELAEGVILEDGIVPLDTGIGTMVVDTGIGTLVVPVDTGIVIDTKIR